MIGTSCSGKTTAVFGVVSQLRKKGYHAEGLTSSDRVYHFDPKLLDYSDKAQAYVILQQAFNEIKAELRNDMDIVVSDRSVLDFYAYLMHCIPEDSFITKAMEGLVFNWIGTYDEIFFLEPLPYVSDGKRPSDEFRMAVDAVLRELIDTMIAQGFKITKVEVPLDEREDYITERIVQAQMQ